MTSPKPIQEVNQMEREQFVGYLGNIIEGAPWVTTLVWSFRPFTDAEELFQSVSTLLDNIPLIAKESILRGYPDLAGKLAHQNQLTQESSKEHAAAGLSNLTPQHQKTIHEFNEKYKAKFDFPFVICARENNVESIMNGLEKRMGNSRDAEVRIGIREIKKICWYRIVDLISVRAHSKI